MTRTYLILKTTDTLSRAIDSQSLDDAHQALIELHDDMQEYEVDDDTYEEVLEGVETLLEVLESRKRASMEGLPDDVASQLADLTHRIESLYLRNSGNDTVGEDSIEQLREERNLYRAKLREYDRKLREVGGYAKSVGVLAEQFGERVEDIEEQRTPPDEIESEVNDLLNQDSERSKLE